MKHQFYFTGQSDDIVYAGSDKRTVDEHYSPFYLLSNGLVIKAEHSGKTGWSIAPTVPAANVTIIAAVDLNDEDMEHDDERIPDWLEAPGYAPVCIIESDEPLEIVATGDSSEPFRDTSPEFIAAARLRAAVVQAADCDEDECPSVDAFLQAMNDIQHALVDHLDLETSRKVCKAMRLPEKFADYCGDDRGNVVDFYDRDGKIAELDREAEWEGKHDQNVFRRTNSRANDEFMAWLAESAWSYVVTEVPEEK